MPNARDRSTVLQDVPAVQGVVQHPLTLRGHKGPPILGRQQYGIPTVVAAGEPVETFIAADLNFSDHWDDSPEDEFWGGTIADSQTTLDDLAAFIVGPPASDEVQVSQDYADDYPHGHDPEDAWWGNVYGFPDQALDVVAQLFPPAVVEPIETFAAQPHYGDDYATYIPLETDDYAAPPEQLEPFAPPEIVVPELASATELREQPWFPEVEFEDYDHSGEPNEWLAPPEVSTVELLAAQPHFGEWVWPEDQTEDYQQDSTVDVTPQFFQVAPEPIETFAAQPHYGEWFWEAQETEDYHQPPQQNGWLTGTAPDAELAANAQILEQPWFPGEEFEGYATDTLSVEAATLPVLDPAQFAYVLPEHWHYETETWIDPPLDEGWLAVLAGGFVGAGPVKGPTRKTALAGVGNAFAILDVFYTADQAVFDDSVALFDDPAITFDGFRRTHSSWIVPVQTSPDDNATEELAGAPRAVPIGSGKNSVEEV